MQKDLSLLLQKNYLNQILINCINNIFIEFTPNWYRDNDFKKMKEIINKNNFVEIWRSNCNAFDQYDIHFKKIQFLINKIKFSLEY